MAKESEENNKIEEKRKCQYQYKSEEFKDGQCPHKPLLDRNLCIFHEKIDKKDNNKCMESFYKLVNIGETNFEGIQLKELILKNKKFKESMNFSRIRVSEATNFLGSTFKGNVSFNLSTFESYIQFNESTFEKDTHFSRATIEFAHFAGSTFKGNVDFKESTFLSSADFSASIFEKNTDFSASKIEENADFRGSTFRGYANFEKSIFGDALFHNSVFSEDANFLMSNFRGNTDFAGSTFDGNVDFRNSIFSAYTSFESSTFKKNADFGGSIFKGDVHFTKSNFEGDANFSKATFKGRVDFRLWTYSDITYFKMVNFTGANLEETNFTGVNLEKANFTRANLEKAKLEKANLKGAIFTDASLFGVKIIGADLSNTTPSKDELIGQILGIDLTDRIKDSIYKAPSAEYSGDIKKSSIFISYCYKDRVFARRLAKDLQNEGIKVWIDEGEILVGDSLLKKIKEAIDEVDYLGVVLTPDSVKSEWVQVEVEIAMNQEIDGKRVKVLPLLAKECDQPNYLKRKKRADLRGDKYVEGLEEVLRRLKGRKNLKKISDVGPKLKTSLLSTQTSYPFLQISEGETVSGYKCPYCNNRIDFVYNGENNISCPQCGGLFKPRVIKEERNNIFQIYFDPELKGELFPDSEDELKCRVNFFSKKGTVAITKIWQHKGGESSFTRMKILDGETKKKIDGGWGKPNVFTVKENELKGIFLIFYREKSIFEPNDLDPVGVEIKTSEGNIRREFNIRWKI